MCGDPGRTAISPRLPSAAGRCLTRSCMSRSERPGLTSGSLDGRMQFHAGPCMDGCEVEGSAGKEGRSGVVCPLPGMIDNYGGIGNHTAGIRNASSPSQPRRYGFREASPESSESPCGSWFLRTTKLVCLPHRRSSRKSSHAERCLSRSALTGAAGPITPPRIVCSTRGPRLLQMLRQCR